eukprot:scaffold81_cov485-Pavlova_lutheri.AAC.1
MEWCLIGSKWGQRGCRRLLHLAHRKNFLVGARVKVMYGLKGPTDKHKLEPYYVGPYIIKQNLGRGAYRLQLLQGSAFSDRMNVDRLELWVDSVTPGRPGSPMKPCP